MPAPTQGDSRTVVVRGLGSSGPLAAWTGDRSIFLLTSVPPARSPHTSGAPRSQTGQGCRSKSFLLSSCAKMLFSHTVVGTEEPRGQSWGFQSTLPTAGPLHRVTASSAPRAHPQTLVTLQCPPKDMGTSQEAFWAPCSLCLWGRCNTDLQRTGSFTGNAPEA